MHWPCLTIGSQVRVVILDSHGMDSLVYTKVRSDTGQCETANGKLVQSFNLPDPLNFYLS